MRHDIAIAMGELARWPIIAGLLDEILTKLCPKRDMKKQFIESQTGSQSIGTNPNA